MKCYTVGVLARSVGLARSTLLYYDRSGLLAPTRRSAAGYRLYDEDARSRLLAIRTYRGVGLGAPEIRALLDARDGRTAAILTARLDRLNVDIAALREQQRVIVRLLKNQGMLARARALDKRGSNQILAAAGLDEAAMHRWHVEFEALAPEAHQDLPRVARHSQGRDRVHPQRLTRAASRAVGGPMTLDTSPLLEPDADLSVNAEREVGLRRARPVLVDAVDDAREDESVDVGAHEEDTDRDEQKDARLEVQVRAGPKVLPADGRGCCGVADAYLRANLQEWNG